MKNLRLRLLFLALWFILIFNLERPEFRFLGFENIDIESMVYILAAGVSIAILSFPELGRSTTLTFLPSVALYVLFKYFSGSLTDGQTAIYIVITEVLLLYLTVAITRYVSASLVEFESVAENVLLAPTFLRTFSEVEGEAEVNQELSRARRFDRPVTFLLIQPLSASRLPSDTGPFLAEAKQRLAAHYDWSQALSSRLVQRRIAKIAETMLYKVDIMVWHNDDLVLCLPETNREEAIKLAKNIRMQIKVRTDFDVTIGIAAFPQDGLIYSDLVTAALSNPVDFRESSWLDELETNKPFVPGSVESDEDAEQEAQSKPSGRLLHITAVLGYRRFDLRTPPDSKGANPFKSSVHDLRNPDLWINNVPYQSASSRLVYRIIKRLLDLSLVLIALPVALPLMIVIALIVRFSDGGSVFFKQQRTGLGGRRFNMYKFRTMVPNAEEKLKELAAEGLAVLDKNGKLAEPLKLEIDPRVTTIGRLLRKTSLDELPQIWNVLRGDMSIVGPRPTSWDLDSYNLMQTERLSVRPGITGLWQVCDRGSTEFDAWVQWDMVYIDKMNLLLDIQIILRTLGKVLKRSGAF